MAANRPDTIHKTQPQVYQIEMRFSAPLRTDEQVEKFTDLLKLKFNYVHKLVWVREHTCYYFLVDGDGSLPIHWKRHWNVSTIEMYDPNKESYLTGEVCYLNGVIYRAMKDVPKGMTPLESGEYWQIIAGESVTVRHLFDNLSTITITTSIRNPQFQVFFGKLTKTADGNYTKDQYGMVAIENPEEVMVPFKVGKTTANGTEYTFEFYNNEKLTASTGVINVK